MAMKTPIAEKAIQILRDCCEKQFGGNVRACSIALGGAPEDISLFRWLQLGDTEASLRAKRSPKLEKVGPYLDAVGAVLLSPEEALEQGRSPENSLPALQKMSSANSATEQDSLRSECERLRMENYKLQGEVSALERQIERMVITFARDGRGSLFVSRPAGPSTS